MSIQFTYSSFLTSAIVFFIVAVCSTVYMKRKKKIFSKFEVFCLIICFGVLDIRLLLPFEYPFTYSVYLPNVYFEVCAFIRKDIWRTVSIFDAFIFMMLIGAILLGGYKIILYYRFCKSMLNSEYMETLELDNGKKIPVMKNRMVDEPFIFGIRNTRIILPEKMVYNSSYVIQHELQHYKNHDLWFSAFYEVLITLYWWNPFVYVIRNYMYNMLELRNDFQITERSSDEEKIDYANTLLQAAKFKQKIRYGLGISSNESFLKCRIYSICENQRKRRSVFVILLTILTVVSSFFIFEPVNKEAPEGTFSIQYDNPYMIRDEKGYHIIIDGHEVGVVDEIPDSFKEVEIIDNMK